MRSYQTGHRWFQRWVERGILHRVCATTCCRLASLKTLAISAADHGPFRLVNVSERYSWWPVLGVHRGATSSSPSTSRSGTSCSSSATSTPPTAGRSVAFCQSLSFASAREPELPDPLMTLETPSGQSTKYPRGGFPRGETRAADGIRTRDPELGKLAPGS
jgi:hypothetical protein